MFDLTGAIGFSYPKKDNLLSRTIARATDSTYSHCFVGAGNFLDQPMVLEATFGGVDVTTWRHYDDEYTLALFVPDPTDFKHEDVLSALKQAAALHLGTPYGGKDLFKMGLSIGLRMIGIPYTPPSSKNLVCSQFVLKYLKALPTVVAADFEHLNDRVITPAQLYVLLERHEYFTCVKVNG